MKTIKISLMLVMLVSSSAFAQTDDMYFVPKKEKKATMLWYMQDRFT